MSRPRPVITKAGIAGAVTSVAGVLSFLGYAHQATTLGAEAQGIGSVVIAVVLLISHLLPAFSAQKDVTPKHAAQADDGMPLIRADAVVPVPQYVKVEDTARHAAPDELGVTAAALDVPDADAVLAAAAAIHPDSPSA